MRLLTKLTLAAAFGLSAITSASALIDPATGRPMSVEDGRVFAAPIPREEVDYKSRFSPGTIVVDTNEKRLYFVLPGGRAIKYGVGVGRPGFSWAGTQSVTRKQEWPTWTPPPQMLKRRPDLPRFMPGGEGNPMGARALYLGSTIYRIHGTNQPETIGHAVSSGCFRLANGDVIDLFERIAVGAKVIIRHGASI